MGGKYNFQEPPRTIEITATRMIARGKVLVVAASITALAANCTAIFYDGLDAAEDILFRLSVVPNMTIGGSFPRGIFFETGLFIAVAGANVAVTISYYTISEENTLAGQNGSD
jgi:hypothetical protein